VGAQDTLRVLTLNLWHDQRDWPARRDVIVEGVRALRPDVVLLQEVLQHATLENQAQDLARRFGMSHVVFASVDSVGRERRYGNAILSRTPFDTTAERKLRPLDQWRIATFARLRVHGHPVRFYTTHLHHVEDAEGGGIRAMQLHGLLDFIGATASDAPFVLGGDLNARPELPEMRLLSPLMDVGAAFGATGPTFGVAHNIAPPGKRIDYLFSGPDARLVPISAVVVFDRPSAGGHYASDHFGVFVRFLLR